MVRVRIREPGEWITFGPCHKCKSELEYLNQPSKTSTFTCPQCQHKHELDPNVASTQTTSEDNTYYQILNVARTATTSEIKKAYHKRAAKIHPDKTGGTTTAEFLELQEAYNILSNDDSRAHYDKHGRGKADDIADIQARFGGIFGGERFNEWTGEIAIISEMGNAIRKGENGDKTDTSSSEDTDKKRAERVATLTRNLANKLDRYDENHPGDFEKLANEWMSDLKAESFGVELLHVIGQVYSLKGSASQYHPETATRWLGTWLPSLRMKGLYISSTVSTVKKAYRVKSAFAKLDKTGTGTEAGKAGLEEEAAKAAIEAIWEGVRVEVIGVVADACDALLTPDPSNIKPANEKQEIEAPLALTLTADERRTLQRRSLALEKLGKLFEAVQREAGQQDIFELLAQGKDAGKT